jgi:hypothetical protein
MFGKGAKRKGRKEKEEERSEKKRKKKKRRKDHKGMNTEGVPPSAHIVCLILRFP